MSKALFTVTMASAPDYTQQSTDSGFTNATKSPDPPGWQTAVPLPDMPTLLDLKASLDFAHHNIGTLKDQIKRQEGFRLQQCVQMDKLQTAYQDIYSYACDLEDHILTVDQNTRKKNLIVSGIPEVLNENSDTLIAKLYGIFQPYIDILDRSDFDVAYRLGDAHRKSKKGRPIVVKFFCEAIRNLVSQIRFNFDDDESTSKIYLNEDLPKTLNDRRNLMRLVVKTARDKEIPAKVAGNKLQVNNITYDYRNLDCLPTGLKPGDITIKEVGGSIVFSSEHAWISNFYPVPVKIQDVVFNSSEQAFQYIKARRNNEPELAAQILKAKLAKEVKKISKGISILPQWDMYKEEVMTRVIEAKFNQNELLARKLVETGSKRLVEATMDKYWAAFATPTSKSIANGTWKGANRMGILLMELRNELRREYPDAVPDQLMDQDANVI